MHVVTTRPVLEDGNDSRAARISSEMRDAALCVADTGWKEIFSEMKKMHATSYLVD